MARKPNYRAERIDRERRKAEKKAKKAKEKAERAEQAERDKLGLDQTAEPQPDSEQA